MKDLKYLAAFSLPLVAFIGLYFKGIFTFLTPFYAFVIIPILELLLPVETSNLDENEVEDKLKRKVFDWLLYLNLPVIVGLLLWSFYTVNTQNLVTYEFISTNERFIGKALLLPSFYMHFYIEHNFGHHLHAATPEDPATARYNQSVYSFWFTSSIRQYLNAWKIQKRLLKSHNQGFLSVKNDMLWYTIFQIAYIGVISFFLGQTVLLFALLAGIVGFIMLETVNYIEHYGLLRHKTKSGRYERVQEMHSWNSNHVVGRIVLYELTRHSDHHYKSSKKYQILDCHDESPQMAYGYPTSMVLSLCPPLWFAIMNKRIPKEMIV